MPLFPVRGRVIYPPGDPPPYDVGWQVGGDWLRLEDQHPGKVWDPLGGWVEPGWRERYEAARERARKVMVAVECREREAMWGMRSC